MPEQKQVAHKNGTLVLIDVQRMREPQPFTGGGQAAYEHELQAYTAHLADLLIH